MSLPVLGALGLEDLEVAWASSCPHRWKAPRSTSWRQPVTYVKAWCQHPRVKAQGESPTSVTRGPGNSRLGEQLSLPLPPVTCLPAPVFPVSADPTLLPVPAP